MSTPPVPVGPGSRLGRYLLVEKIGAGGMGDVYRAIDTSLEREVAVKLLPWEAVATPERRRRFETEAKSAAAVAHPNLVPVYDFGESGSHLYIVEELVQGATVAEMLAEFGPLPLEKVAEWGAQAAEGLACAHEAGILHRDVKPGNFMIGRDDRLRVLDFGLAKMLSSTRRLAAAGPGTSDGLVVGTIHYMSPEQSLGRELDYRSDIFSLGVALYEMATGKRPFEGNSAVDAMHAIAYAPPRPIQPGDPALPPGFLAILEKALEKRPEDRYSSLRDMAVDLRRLLRRSSGTTPALRPAGLPSPSAPTVSMRSEVLPRRRLTPPLRFALFAAAALGGVIGVGYLARPRLPAVQLPRSTRYLVQTNSREEGAVFSPDGRSFAYSSNIRGDYDIYYRLLSGGSPVRLTGPSEDEREPSFTPDGTALYFTRGDLQSATASIWSVPVLGGTMRKIVDRGSEPSFSADGRLLFRRWEGGRTSLYVSGLDGSGPRRVFTADKGEAAGARFSPDGRWIAFLWREAYPGLLGDVWKIPGEGGAPVRLTEDRRDVFGHVNWLAGSAALLFSSVRGGVANVWMVPVDGGTPLAVSGGSGWVVSPSLSPDGKSLLAQTQRNLSDAWEYSLPDGVGKPVTNAGTIWAPIRLPDGRLLYGDWTRQEEEIDLFLEDAGGARTIIAQGSNPRVSHDGRKVYFSTAVGGGRRAVAVVDVDGGPARRLTEPDGADEYPDPTPDGAHLVFCRTKANGQGGVMRLALRGNGAPETLFEGDATYSRAGRDAVVFRSCTPAAGCGVYAISKPRTAPRLLVPDGRWPALSSDGRNVYALTGPKNRPTLVKAALDGGAPAAPIFDFNTERDPTFWAIFTMDVLPEDRGILVTHQRNDDDIVLLDGVFK